MRSTVQAPLEARPTMHPRSAPGDWLRPFDKLAVGETHVSRARTVTETDLIKFAMLTKDLGTQGYAGGAWAKAVLPLTYSIGLVSNSFIGALRRVLDLNMTRPAKSGDTIHVECKIKRLTEWTDDYGLVTGCWAIVDQDGATLMTVVLEAVWRRAPLLL